MSHERNNSNTSGVSIAEPFGGIDMRRDEEFEWWGYYRDRVSPVDAARQIANTVVNPAKTPAGNLGSESDRLPCARYATEFILIG